MILSTWLIIIGLFILPVVLVYYRTIPSRYRILVLLGVTFFSIVFSFLQGRSLLDWGIRLDTIKRVFIPYLLFTLVASIFILLLAWWYKRKPLLAWWNDPHLLFLFIPISIAQEVAYRGFLTPTLGTIFSSPVSIIIFNALLFTFLHIIFYDFKYVLPLIFVGGIGFSWMYYLYPNLIVISIVHCVLNFLAVRHGFFSTVHLRERKHPVYEWADRWGIKEKKKLSYTIHLLFVMSSAFVCIYLIRYHIIAIPHAVLFLVVGIALITLGVSFYQGFTLKDLGIKKYSLSYGFYWHASFTVLFLVFLVFVALIQKVDIIGSIRVLLGSGSHFWSFIALQTLISIGQAFVFRGFLIRQLQVIFDDTLVVVLLSASIFTLAHLMYVDFSMYSIILFFVGTGFSWVYIKRPSLIWSSVSHSILNITAVALGALSLI